MPFHGERHRGRRVGGTWMQQRGNEGGTGVCVSIRSLGADLRTSPPVESERLRAA